MDGGCDRMDSAHLGGQVAEFNRMKKQSPAWQRGLARGRELDRWHCLESQGASHAGNTPNYVSAL